MPDASNPPHELSTERFKSILFKTFFRSFPSAIVFDARPGPDQIDSDWRDVKGRGGREIVNLINSKTPNALLISRSSIGYLGIGPRENVLERKKKSCPVRAYRRVLPPLEHLFDEVGHVLVHVSRGPDKSNVF